MTQDKQSKMSIDMIEPDPALASTVHARAIEGKEFPQFVLAMDSHVFAATEFMSRGAVWYDMEHFLIVSQRYLIIRELEELNQRDDYRQLMPLVVMVFTDANGELRFWPYVRATETDGVKGPDSVCIGVGTNVDLDNVIFTQRSAIDLGATLTNAADNLFELLVTGDGAATGSPFGKPHLIKRDYANCMLIANEGAHKHHVGIVIRMVVDPAATFECNQEGVHFMDKAMTAKELLRAADIEKRFELDQWSRLFLATLGD